MRTMCGTILAAAMVVGGVGWANAAAAGDGSCSQGGQDGVRAAYLTKLYLSSVGNAATMNIGIAPNRDGLLDADDVKALAGFGVMRKALFAREAMPGGPFNVVVMKEDVSNGEHVDGWRVLADGREILRGRSIGMKRIRLLPEPVAAGKCEVEVTAGGGKVELRRYIADAELVKTILEADADSGETDTAKWMTAAAANH